MDLTSQATAILKNPEVETEATQTPIRIQPAKPLAFSNGVLKRHNSLQLHHGFNGNHHNHHHHPVVVMYKECLKNHAASIGGHAVDGCGEFMPSPTATPTDPTSLKCAACGCHRNFHRREPEETLPVPNATPALEYQPHHRHHPLPPPPLPHRGSGGHSSPNSPSPPPISSAYYPASAPHMLLALSAGLGQSGPNPDTNQLISQSANPIMTSGHVTNPNARKRFRTKFTQDQKEKMLEFAERVEWKMQKRDEELVNEFCSKIGVEKGVLKVWMHNNKNTFGSKKDQSSPVTVTPTINNLNGNTNGIGIGFDFVSRNNNTDDAIPATTDLHIHHRHESNNDNDKEHNNHHNNLHNNDNVSAHVVTTNGSSSSS